MRAALLATMLFLLPLGAPSSAADDVHARNVAFLWSLVGDADPLTAATMHDGRVLSLAEALDEAAARAGAVDLAALAHGALSPTPIASDVPLGDVWVIEQGEGGCERINTGVGWPFFMPTDPQLWMYSGAIGTLSTAQGDTTLFIGWTIKWAVLAYDTPGFTAIGNQDFYCFEYQGRHFAFPFVDGEAHINLEGSR